MTAPAPHRRGVESRWRTRVSDGRFPGRCAVVLGSALLLLLSGCSAGRTTAVGAGTVPAATAAARSSMASDLQPHALPAAVTDCGYPDDAADLASRAAVADLVAAVRPSHVTAAAAPAGTTSAVEVRRVLLGSGNVGDQVNILFPSGTASDPFPGQDYVLFLRRAAPGSSEWFVADGVRGLFSVRSGAVFGSCVDAVTLKVKDSSGTSSGESVDSFARRLLSAVRQTAAPAAPSPTP